MNLLPCPFCGCEMHVKPLYRSWYRLEGDHDDTCFFYAEDSRLQVPLQDDQKALLIKDWNRRASPEPLTDEQIMAIGQELGKQCKLGGNPNIDFDYARAIEKAHGIGKGE